MTLSPRSDSSGDLRERLVGLAGTPDDDPAVQADLIIIAQMAVNRIAAVSYASMTGCSPGGYVTVAATSDLARAVDEAQYADGSGPCLEAFDSAFTVEVSDISATMGWPGFRAVAMKLGLQTSLSIPLFAGRGTPVASLNLYCHVPAAMRPLSLAVGSVYGLEQREEPVAPYGLDAGEISLVAGLTGAFAVRGVIQQAISVLMALTASDSDLAYSTLCIRAAESNLTLLQVAARVIPGQRW